MVLKYITKGGSRIYGPPYTEAEQDDFYRRVGRGPVTVARPTSDRKAPTSQRRSNKLPKTIDNLGRPSSPCCTLSRNDWSKGSSLKIDRISKPLVDPPSRRAHKRGVKRGR